MTLVGTETNPLRVAIIGSGPAAFYAADELLKQKDFVIEIDMFDRLPTPFGLVRGGVAPDHQKIKSVTKVYDGIASHPRFRFYGNVEYGQHIKLIDLKEHYHQILFATGAQTDRRMGIPGEDLDGSHPATEFVAWYNGHPDYRDRIFDLSHERVAVVGVGNVAIDVARILCLTPKELAETDMADYAIEALSHSQVKEVHLLGRRGPAQAAFTNPEIKEVGELEDADAITLSNEVQLDELSLAELASLNDRSLNKKVEIIQSYAQPRSVSKARKLYIRFLVSPVEMIGSDQGKVCALKLVHNVLYKTEAGTLSPKAIDQFEQLNVGLVFRSVGYRGVPLPEVPFNDRYGVIMNDKGRVIEVESKQPVIGEYASGWIKRGPSGVIGTNKPDSVETVTHMLEDLKSGSILQPAQPEVASMQELVKQRQPKFFSYPDWKKLDELEVAKGQPLGRPRVKFTSVEEMIAALGK
jgi:ferredoxin--NADP+ reductase